MCIRLGRANALPERLSLRHIVLRAYEPNVPASGVCNRAQSGDVRIVRDLHGLRACMRDAHAGGVRMREMGTVWRQRRSVAIGRATFHQGAVRAGAVATHWAKNAT